MILSFLAERGKAANLMKNSSKRKRKADEIQEVFEEEKALKSDKQKFLIQAKRLKDEN